MPYPFTSATEMPLKSARLMPGNCARAATIAERSAQKLPPVHRDGALWKGMGVHGHRMLPGEIGSYRIGLA